MKTGYKIILIILSFIVFSEVIQFLTKTPILKKYVTKLDNKNRAYIDSASKLAGFQISNVPNDYSSILNSGSANGAKELKFIKTIGFRFRYPVSEYIFQNKYLIQISKIDTNNNLNLNTAITEENIEASEENNVGYAIEQNGLLKCEYNNSKHLKISKMHLTIDGIDTQLLNKTDSTIYYFSTLKNMSIRYNDLPQDILISSSSNIPVEILVCKKKLNLYLIMATVDNTSSILDKGLLYNLIYR